MGNWSSSTALKPKPRIQPTRNKNPQKAKAQSNSAVSQSDVRNSMPATTPETSNGDASATNADPGAANNDADDDPRDVRCEPPPQMCKYHPGQIAYKASYFPRLTEITTSSKRCLRHSDGPAAILPQCRSPAELRPSILLRDTPRASCGRIGASLSRRPHPGRLELGPPGVSPSLLTARWASPNRESPS